MTMGKALRDGYRDKELALVECEIDDQTPEDLSIGLDRLREMPAIYDVLPMSAYNKKRGLVMHVRLLTDPPVAASAWRRNDNRLWPPFPLQRRSFARRSAYF